MDSKKFGLLKIERKENVTHADIQKKSQSKKGGRPRKKSQDKLSCIVSINVNVHEKKSLEEESFSMGVTVLSFIRMAIVRALKNNFAAGDMTHKIHTSNKITNEKVIKQYAIPVTQIVKSQLENWSTEFMLSISDLLKIALKNIEYKKV